MPALRPISLLLAGFSLLIAVVAGMALYAMQLEQPTLRFQPAVLNVTAGPESCAPLARLYSYATESNRQSSGLWRVGLEGFLLWGALSAVMFSWVYAFLRKLPERSPPPQMQNAQ